MAESRGRDWKLAVARRGADADRFDLIVIGAGINGAGIARDAALRGLRVLVLDKGDVAGGTTSWSTRLIHGGLRYLEHGEIGLVRESLRERERLLHIAPHLVRPLPLLFPIYRGDQRGRLLIRAGMVAYDVLSHGKSLPRHRMLDRAAALGRAPGLAEPDCSAPRSTTMLRSSTRNGSRSRTRSMRAPTGRRSAPITRSMRSPRRRARHWRGGTRRPDRRAVPVRGAGCRQRRRTLGRRGACRSNVDQQPRLIGGSKGSHIVVEPFPGAPRDALYAEARQDGRPFFIIPWNDLYLIGTTDTRYDGDLDRVMAEEWEIDFLCRDEPGYPDREADAGDVLYTYAGVRPLPYAPGRRKGASPAVTSCVTTNLKHPAARGA